MDIKKFWTLLAIALTGLFAMSCGGDDDDTPGGNDKDLEVAVTVQVSEITDHSAQLTGTVRLDLITIKYSSISYGMEISRDADFKTPVRVLASSLTNNSFTVIVDNLSAETKYWYRTCVMVQNMSYYGQAQTFTTAKRGGSDQGTEVAVTGDASEITENSAKISGTVNLGLITTSYSNVEYGVQYSLYAEFKPSSSYTQVNSQAGGSFSVYATDLQDGAKYWYRTYVKAQNHWYYGQTRTFTTEASAASNGHAYVDLELPSGTLWATCNVGAEQPEDYGLYFAWGETTGYTSDTSDGRSFDWSTYKWCRGSETSMTKYCTDSRYGTVDNKRVLELEDDAAHVHWGGAWRLPTDNEIHELLDNTTHQWTTQNGVYGCKLTSHFNASSIFLPAAGYRRDSSCFSEATVCHYWSSTLLVDDQSKACGLTMLRQFGVEYVGTSDDWRFLGCSVRPVRSK